ncbi:putative N-acetyltransferase (TIGR04045 family) [Novosphingobium sp. SG751A]|uniref:MSMEG_0567/Sll0786 family nitrogen starvation N-acetyltransferase n=1 Tax=unclassified Novosphingobium TaxID=2644732 RepID=UPI001444E54D|nr:MULTISPECIES: MSMEG_0567/Sll0786 family nitrogen starvation N-acetyltransferase [unclassified Novosphingobium]NKJ01622.1 putative N-acetyltransferase (TIGR04045 family) [Novosphingobium sp. SG707]NOW47748.1 putative N-acetyltransferase (TIGR04045 family) [Novosphingobium sp. SG751A]
MDLASPAPFRSPDYIVRYATQSWELAGAAALRHAVFCAEQGLFAHHDRDDVDALATPIVALSMIGGQPDEVIGTVRIHSPEPGLWWGSRLAVAASHRTVGTIGPALIRLAVSTAHARGCTRFLAHVQARNELLFRRMKWERIDMLDLHDSPHALMQADLSHYPPIADGITGLRTETRRAA